MQCIKRVTNKNVRSRFDFKMVNPSVMCCGMWLTEINSPAGRHYETSMSINYRVEVGQ